MNPDGAGNIQFTTQGAERMRVTSSGNLGIGTNSPARELSIGNGTGSPNIQLLAANTGNSRLEFGDTDDSDVGEIQYVHTDNSMRIFTNGTESARLESDADLHVDGNVIRILQPLFLINSPQERHCTD